VLAGYMVRHNEHLGPAAWTGRLLVEILALTDLQAAHILVLVIEVLSFQ
jgi:hypothetical protein